MSSEVSDHYQTLGASENASQEEIERLYRRLAREHHPDRGGDEERMKSINEAFCVLRHASSRIAYDADRRSSRASDFEIYRSSFVASPPTQADVLSGRILGAWLCTLSGLVLLFLVRVHYVRFLWPLGMLAVLIIIFGVLMAHGALTFARSGASGRNFLRRFIWAQEFAFWSLVCAGAYGVYLLLAEF